MKSIKLNQERIKNIVLTFDTYGASRHILLANCVSKSSL